MSPALLTFISTFVLTSSLEAQKSTPQQNTQAFSFSALLERFHCTPSTSLASLNKEENTLIADSVNEENIPIADSINEENQEQVLFSFLMSLPFAQTQNNQLTDFIEKSKTQNTLFSKQENPFGILEAPEKNDTDTNLIKDFIVNLKSSNIKNGTQESVPLIATSSAFSLEQENFLNAQEKNTVLLPPSSSPPAVENKNVGKKTGKNFTSVVSQEYSQKEMPFTPQKTEITTLKSVKVSDLSSNSQSINALSGPINAPLSVNLNSYSVITPLTVAQNTALSAQQTLTHSTPPAGAVEALAIVLGKAGQDGQNRRFVVQMDPPELGRVDVHLEFGRNKAVKAVLLVEKPETYFLLQRDAQVLERSLQGTGLDTGSGLQFSLAQGNGRRGDGDKGDARKAQDRTVSLISSAQEGGSKGTVQKWGEGHYSVVV